MQRFVPAPPGIRFSNCIFSEPVPLARWWQPRGVGLFVILLPDLTWGPRPFQPVFFGEFGADAPVTQDEYVSWFRVAAGRHLYIAVHDIGPARSGSLAAMKSELVRAHGPICNRGGGADETPQSLCRRLEMIEKRDLEHDALLRVMLAAMGKLLEPPPEPRKRDFGFHINRQKGPDAARVPSRY